MTADHASAVPLRADFEVISLVGFAHGTSHFFHLMIPSLFPWLMRDFGLNFTQAGSLTAAFFVASGIGQALAGFAVDRFGAQRALRAGIALFSIAAVVLGLASSYAMLLAAALLAGIGNCVFHPADFTVLNRRVSPPRLGHAFSVHGLSGNLGWAAGPVFMTTIAASVGWRPAAFAAGSVAVVALALLVARRSVFAATTFRHDAEPAGNDAPPAAAFAFLGSAAVWMCFFFFLVVVMAFGGLQNFAPTILERTYGVSLGVATSGLTAYLLGSAAGIAAGGFFASQGDRQEHLVAGSLVVAAACAMTLASAAVPSWTIVTLMGLMGAGAGFSNPSRDILVRRAATASFGVGAYGRVYGFVYSGIDAGLALAPLAFGPLMDAGRYTLVLWGVASLQTLAILAALAVGWRSRA